MKNKLIAYALDFVSYLVEKDVKLERVILFGSVVSGEFDNDSDIDIFVECSKTEDKVNQVLREFEKIFGESWKLKGVENMISLKVGKLDEWHSLKRDIQSNGLVLYGDYKEMPEDVESYVLFLLDFNKLSRAKQVSLWRRLYGYSQKVGKKVYSKAGLVKGVGGARINRSVVAVPSGNSGEFRKFLNKEKIGYRVKEVWAEGF